jgi:ribosomal protein L14
MIQIGTHFQAVDNVGIGVGRCVHVYRGFFAKSTGTVGTRVLVSVRKKLPNKILKKKMYWAVITKTKFAYRRPNGHVFRFLSNGFVVLHDLDSYRGTRIKGPFLNDFRFGRFNFILPVTSKIV